MNLAGTSKERMILWSTAIAVTAVILMIPAAVAQMEERASSRRVATAMGVIKPIIRNKNIGALLKFCDGTPLEAHGEWVRCCYGTENTPFLGPDDTKVRVIVFANKYHAMAGKYPLAIVLTSMDLHFRRTDYTPGENGTCLFSYPTYHSSQQ